MARRKCTICGKPVVLIPSAKERAEKDITGSTTEDYYTRLFPDHSKCTLRRNAEEVRELMLNGGIPYVGT